MAESTAPEGQPTDETGRLLTDSEVAAVVRSRPHLMAILVMHVGDRVLVESAGVRVEWGPGPDGVGSVVVSRAAVRAALEGSAG